MLLLLLLVLLVLALVLLLLVLEYIVCIGSFVVLCCFGVVVSVVAVGVVFCFALLCCVVSCRVVSCRAVVVEWPSACERNHAAQAIHHRGVVAFVLLPLPLLIGMERAGGHRQRSRPLETVDEVEPPPVPKHFRTSRRMLRQMQDEASSSSGPNASGGQSGHPGSLREASGGQSGHPGSSGGAHHGQSGNPGSSGGAHHGQSGNPGSWGAQQSEAEFRSFVGKLYLRTHGKSL